MLGVAPSSIREIDISWNTGLVPSWVIALHHSMPLVYCLILNSFILSMTEAFLATRIEAIVSQYFVHVRSCRSTSWDSHAVDVRSDILRMRVGFCCWCIWLLFFHFSKSRDIDTALAWGSIYFMIFLVQNPVWQVPQSVYSLELLRRGCYLRFNLDSLSVMFHSDY